MYFPPNRISRVKVLAVYLKRCDTINAIPDIRLIDLTKIHEFVLKFPSWTGKADETDDFVKNKDIKFEPTKFKSFRDNFKTLLCAIRGCRGITLEYIIRNGTYVRSPPERYQSQMLIAMTLLQQVLHYIGLHLIMTMPGYILYSVLC